MIMTSALMAMALTPVSYALAKEMVLESPKSTASIVIDGKVDAAWDEAEPLIVKVNRLPYKPNNGYEGIKRTDVELKSLHDDEYVYFLVIYSDPTKSIERFPWVRQSDGSWKQLINKDSTGHENTYYEDKFAMYWNISADGFAERGCNVACHRAKDGMNAGRKDTNPARKYTLSDDEFIDMWHWKGVRTAVHNQLDDQYVDNNTDPKLNKGWGRKGDTKTSGGYVNNIKDGQPAYVADDLTNETLLILESDKQPFTADYNKTDRIPGLTGAPFMGSRGDVDVGATWEDGVWTLEMKRKLVTDGENAQTQDVQFDDLTQLYPFGVAVFDNSQINHIYHRGVINLEFK
ncbi:ethylbenzene dehydrogenase [Vibrio ponticus]|uniref:Ethylbenzene dehydrogenase n=1 Tax=Vibrio ponticus TaxID=265668 RepID=A0A3N3DU81_9VIBR|nr:ethylbenzene dehydrogenase-related protein [Vibrio ponticus]ROV58047.1 ethylbenzene dehydrogenase [Vibrio ponticus]